jgi:hypothetical protein
MIIKKRVLDKLFNSDLIKKVYPMIDKIDCGVNWDGDEEFPNYEIYLDIYLNDPSITEKNMYRKEFDPHYLVDMYLIKLMKMAGIDMKEIENFIIKVYNSDGEIIYPSES